MSEINSDDDWEVVEDEPLEDDSVEEGESSTEQDRVPKETEETYQQSIAAALKLQAETARLQTEQTRDLTEYIKTQPKQQAIPQAPPAQLTQAQIDELNMQFQMKPLASAATLANLIVEQRIAEFSRTQGTPIVSTVAAQTINGFKMERKDELADSPGMYAKIVAKFNDEIADIPTEHIVGMNDAQRSKELMRRWKASKAEVLEEAMKANAPKAQPLNFGGSGSRVAQQTQTHRSLREESQDAYDIAMTAFANGDLTVEDLRELGINVRMKK